MARWTSHREKKTASHAGSHAGSHAHAGGGGGGGPRSVWKGFVRFSLVSVPCRAYTAAGCDRGAPGGDSVALHQLHKGCGARIKYVKTCPIHGEVTTSEIEKGYEFSKDQYVVIEPEEIEKISAENERTISVESFLKESEIDPMYHSGRTMYLAPDGPAGRKPYAMMHQAMVEEKRVAFARGVFSNRESIMLLRPVGKLIVMTHLHFAGEVRPMHPVEGMVPDVETNQKELELAKMLIGQLTEKKFDLEQHRDVYADSMKALIASKVEGKEVVAPPSGGDEEPQVGNLLEALQRSLAEAEGKTVTKSMPARKVAAGPRIEPGARHVAARPRARPKAHAAARPRGRKAD